jgi:hypothetical protein
MGAGRVKVVFRESIDLPTVDMFAVVLEIFGHMYRTQDARAIVVMPPDERKANDLRLQLEEWEKEGAVESWNHAT